MGCYVNPPGERKEDFLLRVGKPIVNPPARLSDVPEGHHLVVLLHNALFTAAAVAYCESEFAEFTRKDEKRRRLFYLVPISELWATSSLKEEMEYEERLRQKSDLG
jgi:hypothetical protein